jgi:hypothetical protein
MIAILIWAGGCSTVKSRIEEKAAVFNSLDPQAQARLRQGIVDIGYTEDMVYIAMGRPDQTKERQAEGGVETEWIYNEYWQEYQGRQFAGYRRIVYFDPTARAYRYYYEPVQVDVYRDRVEQKTRITFKNGKVSAIEQVKE